MSEVRKQKKRLKKMYLKVFYDYMKQSDLKWERNTWRYETLTTYEDRTYHYLPFGDLWFKFNDLYSFNPFKGRLYIQGNHEKGKVYISVYNFRTIIARIRIIRTYNKRLKFTKDQEYINTLSDNLEPLNQVGRSVIDQEKEGKLIDEIREANLRVDREIKHINKFITDKFDKVSEDVVRELIKSNLIETVQDRLGNKMKVMVREWEQFMEFKER